jgi:S-DNA-T family DNA segregation ATPase FtsK/SpoIIIE
MAKPSPDMMNFQADRIERVLASHRVPVRVHSGTVMPRWIRFLLTPALGAKVASVRNLSEELALALGAADVRVAREGESIAVEVPRDDPEPVLLSNLLRTLAAIPPVTACLGFTDDGRPLLLRLPRRMWPMCSSPGPPAPARPSSCAAWSSRWRCATGSRNCSSRSSTPRAAGSCRWAACRTSWPTSPSDPAAALNLLERLLVEMERRDRANVSAPRIVIVIDELLDLLATGGKPVELALTRLAQRGREAGLHLVAGAQKPSAAALGPMLKANFPVRLIGRVGSAEDARVAARGRTNAERLLGRGDFMWRPATPCAFRRRDPGGRVAGAASRPGVINFQVRRSLPWISACCGTTTTPSASSMRRWRGPWSFTARSTACSPPSATCTPACSPPTSPPWRRACGCGPTAPSSRITSGSGSRRR